MDIDYDPRLCFWIIGGNTSHYWSSMVGAYVQALPPGVTPVPVDTEQNLSAALVSVGLSGPVIQPQQVDAERDRRIAAGFLFNGVLFQSRVDDQKRIAGATTLAQIAIANGAAAGDMRWYDPSNDFVWIADSNMAVAMDAHTVVQFGKTAALWESAHFYAGRNLKNMSPIPQNYRNNLYWP